MIVKIRDTEHGTEWVLTEDGDPLQCDEYVDLVKMWGVYIWPRGREASGNDAPGFTGSFHLSQGETQAVFTVDVHHEDGL